MKFIVLLLLFHCISTNNLTMGLLLPDESILTYSLNRIKRLVGGTEATPSDFSFMAVIYLLQPLGIVDLCGGAVISPQWILTSAACIPETPLRRYVITGVANRSEITKKDLQEIGETFKSDTGNMGLIKMNISLDTGCKFKSATLPKADFQVPLNQKGTILGYGVYEKGSKYKSVFLRSIDVEIVSKEDCESKESPVMQNSTHLCSISDVQGACRGDRGGPLVIDKNMIIGIISIDSDACNASTLATTYEKVADYRDWIASVTGI